jgi:hypothetical protein
VHFDLPIEQLVRRRDTRFQLGFANEAREVLTPSEEFRLAPSNKGLRVLGRNGDFYRKGLRIRGWNARLRYLDKGQQWVADRIATALPRLTDLIGKKPLQAMYESHLANIAIRKEQMT